MAINLSALSVATTSLLVANNLILVTPQKNTGIRAQSKDGLILEPSMLFNYETNQTATLTSDITDHFVEDNTTINDQIALRPEIITTQGFIGELNNVTPESLESVRIARDKLLVVSAYTPNLSATALRAYNIAQQAYQAAESVQRTALSSLNSAFNNDPTNTVGSAGLEGSINPAQTKQQIAFQKFYSYWRERRLFTVQTPWAIFKNMAIQSLKASQGEDSELISDFEISFKAMRFAQTIFITKDQAGRAGIQSSGAVNKGATKGRPV